MNDESAPRPPLLRVVHGGEPTAPELAALVAVLTSRAGATTASTSTPRPGGGWASRAAGLRRPLFPGPGAWAASARPHR